MNSSSLSPSIPSKKEGSELLNYLNQQHQRIKFTMEEEVNGSLPFMDIRFSRQNDNHLAREVYKKPTHTSRYVTYDSHHPTSVKSSIVQGLAQRAIMVSSDPISWDKELRRISTAMAWNGYPKKIVDKAINRQMRRPSMRQTSQSEEDQPKTSNSPYSLYWRA